MGVILDITARKRTEEELRLAKAEIEQLLQSLSSILIGLSPAGGILQWNQAAARVLGLEADQVLEKPLGEIPIEWNIQRVMEGVATCSETANTVRIDDLPFTRSDGKQGFLGLTISPIMEGEDRLGGIIILGADITACRLLEVQLSQAQKLESIGQLAAGIAHEINTPIQFVSDNTRFMQEAFGRSSRLTRYIQDITHVMRLKDRWQVETAAMLSQIGCIMLPEATFKNLYHGKPLSPHEQQVFQMHPYIAKDLLKNIPRLEGVAKIVSYQGKLFDGRASPRTISGAKRSPWAPASSRWCWTWTPLKPGA